MAKSFVKKKQKVPFLKTQKLIQADNGYVTAITCFVSSDKLLDFLKVNFLFFLQSLFFLMAPPSMGKTPTNKVKTK